MSAGRSCRAAERVGAGRRGRHAVPGFHEMKHDERDDIRLVVNDENPFARDAGSYSPGASVRLRRSPCEFSPTISSIATVLWPPRGTITSA